MIVTVSLLLEILETYGSILEVFQLSFSAFHDFGRAPVKPQHEASVVNALFYSSMKSLCATNPLWQVGDVVRWESYHM